MKRRAGSNAVVAAPNAAAEPNWPDDAVEVGRLVGGWGVKGWIKVQPHAADPQGLLRASHWFVETAAGPGRPAARNVLAITAARSHGDVVVASALQCTDRDAADALRGARVFISRRDFPPEQRDEYYWVDLIGAAVFNRQGEALGTVSGMLDTGAHSVLCVAPADPAAPERLIPFVAAYVDAVDVPGRRIVVDWGLDY